MNYNMLRINKEQELQHTQNRELSPENLIYITTQRMINERDLSLLAERILVSISSQITMLDIEEAKEYMNSAKFYTYTIDLKIFAELFGYSTIKFRTRLKEARDELHKIIVKFPGVSQAMTGVISGSYIENNQLKVHIHPLMIPFYAIKGRSYELANTLNFKNPHSFKFYEIFLNALEDGKQAYLIMELEKIRNILKLEKKYPQYSTLKKYVLNPLIEDINQESKQNLCNITVLFEEIKNKKRVQKIRFIIKRKEIINDQVITISDVYQNLTFEGKQAYNFFLKEAKQGSGFLDQIITKDKERFLIETYNGILEKMKENKIQHLNSYCGKALREKWFINTLSENRNNNEHINTIHQAQVEIIPTIQKPNINNDLMNKFMKLTKIQQEFIYNQLANNSDNLWYTQRLKNVSLDEMLQDISKKSQFKVLLNKDPKVLEFLNSIELKED